MRDELQIVEFTPAYAGAFLQLNLEWLEKFFYVEDIDRAVLTHPQSEIIDQGGQILFAVHGGEVCGTVALKHFGGGCYELTKMAVTASRQGAGIGRALMIAAIDKYRALAGKKLYLETHSSLVTAIALYESAGFVHHTPPRPSEYARADTYMVFQPTVKPLISK
jgi:putative acetyltransferase